MTTSPESLVGRRNLLRTAGTASLGAALLAACGGNADTGDAAATPALTPTPTDAAASASPSAPSVQDEIALAAQAAGFDGPVDQTVIIATFETLALPGQRMQFGVLDAERSPILGDPVQAAIVRASDFEVVAAATTPTFYGEDLGPRGVYVFSADLTSTGIHYLVVQTSAGNVGSGVLNIIDPTTSQVPRTGDAFPLPPTPTVEDPQDLVELCTREPDCSMHDLSLDEGPALGKPMVVCIATPKYCQTAVCGPVVDVVEALKQERGSDDVSWFHIEVYVDAGNTPLPQVTETWQLPSEPWTFLLHADGTVADRFDGPVVPSLLAQAVDALLA